MEIRFERGDVVVCALSGDYGKPRPAVVIQSDLFIMHGSITVCPITTHIIEAPLFRLLIHPNSKNNLKELSEIMVDKMTAIPREKIRQRIGALSSDQKNHLDQALKIWLELF